MLTAEVRPLSGEPVWGDPVTLGHVAELLSGLLFFYFILSILCVFLTDRIEKTN